MELPSEANQFLSEHVDLLLGSYHRLTGRELIPSGPDAARRLFEAPFFVASHSPAADPVLTYGNQTALDLFEMSWEAFTSTPSRFTAEAPERDERARLLHAVQTQGYIDDYSGVRISSTGKRLRIQRATIWDLRAAEGRTIGQAATFSSWTPL